MNRRELLLGALAITASLAATGCKGGASGSSGSVEILNVSYDPTRELYEAVNKAFAQDFKAKNNREVTIKQSHGGSGKQARSVIDGLEADVVTLGLAYDVDAIAKAGLVKAGWPSRFANNAVPFSSTIVFLVRKGNPQNIKDWPDLARDGVKVITANPKTSGGARWSYLAAWGFAVRSNGGNDQSAEAFVTNLYKNVPVLDSGARGATTTFVERGIGDVLIAWENEALLAVEKLGKDKVELVVPSVSILAEPPVAVVDSVVDKRGTRAVAEAYLQFLYTDEAQAIAARNFYRPAVPAAFAKVKDKFADLKMFTVTEVFGSWADAQKKHFDDGGVFDRIYGPSK